MNRLKPWLFMGIVLTISLAIFGYGVWIALDGAQHLNRYELKTGILILLFGPMAVLPFVVVAINRFVPSERLRLQQTLKHNRPAARKNFIRKREKNLQRMQFLKRHPSAVFFFILGALVVLTIMALYPDSIAKKSDVTLLHLFGIVFGLAYAVAMVFFLYALLTRKWEPYMETSIAKLEEQLIQAKMEGRTDPSTGSG